VVGVLVSPGGPKKKGAITPRGVLPHGKKTPL